MTINYFKISVIGLMVTAIVTLGFASPAQAATISPTATSSSLVGTTGTNQTPITVSATLASVNAAESIKVLLPTGWSFVSPPRTCAATVTNTVSVGSLSNCFVTVAGGDSWIFLNNSGGGLWGTAVTVTVTFNQGVLNVGSSRDFRVEYKNGGAVIDSGVATLVGTPSFSATFNSNNGSGSMADQSGNSVTTLNTNAFTRSGYTFAGWNTAADGSGTVYADGASFPFTSNETLYAQWSAILANTGINSATGASLLASGLSLALIGAVMFMIARRKRSN